LLLDANEDHAPHVRHFRIAQYGSALRAAANFGGRTTTDAALVEAMSSKSARGSTLRGGS